MLYVNLEYKGKKESFNFGAVPNIGDVVIHPEWRGTKVIKVIWDIHDKTKDISITVRLIAEDEYEATQKK
ncbi:MAG: hypothetical protein AAB676_15325 [Verrucomicrobiota bacterium]